MCKFRFLYHTLENFQNTVHKIFTRSAIGAAVGAGVAEDVTASRSKKSLGKY